MKKRVADIVVEALIDNGIEVCFSVVGGYSMHLNNAFYIEDRIDKIYNHHEQACAMAAEGYARSKGKLAAVCVTSGPGALNTLNGVQGAWVDSVPMIVISGSPRYKLTAKSMNLNIRCGAEQENNIVEQVRNITKYATQILDPHSVRKEIKYAIQIAMEGRRGPVWLDIPLDIQGQLIDEEQLLSETTINESLDTKIIEEKIDTLIKALSEAKRPCILTGTGLRTGCAMEGFEKFIDKVRIPIVGGCQVADVCYNNQDNYYGMSGVNGPRTGNFILQNADMILVLGNSLSNKQTGYEKELFAPNADIHMVDVQKEEAYKPGLTIKNIIDVDLKIFFEICERKLYDICAPKEWFAYCEKVNGRFVPFEVIQSHGEFSSEESVPALYFWRALLEQSRYDTVFALGNNSAVGGILREGIRYEGQRVIVNYNSGSMGHDLPNAIGAAYALQKEVILVTGDGSIMMNIQELQTINHYNLPVKVVVFNNDGYGALRRTWNRFFDGKYAGCDANSGISFPSFKNVAETFGFVHRKCENVGEVEECIEWLYSQKSFCMLEINQRIDEISGPSLSSKMNENGEFFTPAIHDLTPSLDKEEIDELMLND